MVPELSICEENTPRATGELARPKPRVLLFAITAAVLVGLCFMVGMGGYDLFRPLHVPGLLFPGGELSAGRMILLFLALWAAGLAALLLFPRGLGRKRGAVLILSISLLCRLLLLPHPPSDDLYRYLWEGRILAAGLSPYSHPPVAADDPAADRFRDPGDPIWTGINHPEMTAIYPPLTSVGLAVIASTWYTPLAVKLVIVLFDLGTLALLLLLLHRRRLSQRLALLYAVNPVVLIGFAGQGHLDAAQGLLVLGAILLYRRKRWAWMFLLAGLAVQVKYVAILGWPFLLRRDNIRLAWIAPLAALAPLAVFLGLEGPAVFDSLIAFGREFAFNGPVHAVLRLLLGGIVPAAAFCRLLLLPLLGFAYWRFHPRRNGSACPDPLHGWLFVFCAFLLFSPTVHFWYLAWILPLLAVRPSVSWLALSGTAAFTFVAVGRQYSSGEWSYPHWALIAVWAIPLLLMLAGLPRVWRRFRGGMKWPAPGGVSVVVPAIDEAERIGDCIEALHADPAVREIIVVDGGSSDDTVEKAGSLGARVLVHHQPPELGGGRGGQIAAGCRGAREDLVAVVHADTLVAPGSLSRARDVLARNPDVAGGALGSVFDGRGLKYRLLETANDLRAALTGISFGDQVQFFRRAPVVEGGLLSDIPLMEDVELGLCLREIGRTIFLWERSLVSSRRWQSGAAGKSLLVIRLTTGYLLRRKFGRPDTVAMYHRYYS